MTDCVFCDPAKTKDRTVAVLDSLSIVATLGQITDGGYLLLIPTAHVPCLGAVDKKFIKTINFDTDFVIEILKREYRMPTTVFEHGIVGQTIKHAHLHFLPAYLDLGRKIRQDFPKSEIQTVPNLRGLQRLYQARQEPYLLWSTDPHLYSICWNPPAAPQYFRTIAAKMLNVPNRADWKNMDPLLDKVLADNTVNRIAPYFYT